jgi:predicted phage terminase large subunit-like protein
MLIRHKGTLIDTSEVLLEIERAELEQSLAAFTAAAWPAIDSAPFAHGGYVIDAISEHLEAVVDGHIQGLLINVPPRFSKSTIVGTMLPAWVYAQPGRTPLAGPGCSFLCASYGMSLSVQDSVRCRTLLLSDWYQRRWGDRFAITDDQNTKTRFATSANGVRIAISVGSATTGLGATYLIGDDLNNATEANSEAVLRSTIDWWQTAFYNRLNNSKPGHGARIVIAQRLNELDISGHILEAHPEFVHLCLPMRYEADRSFYTVLVPGSATADGRAVTWRDPREREGELLWPERFDEDQVALLEKTLGPYGAAGQLQQRPAPAGGGILKAEWWQTWVPNEFPPFSYILASLDCAYTAKTENDYSAMVILGIWYGSSETMVTRHVDRYGRVRDSEVVEHDEINGLPRVMLMTAWQEKLELHELVKKVAKTCRDLKADKVLVENKAAGISVGQELRRIYGATEEFAVQLYDPKNLDKVARLHSVAPLFAEGTVFAPDRNWADTVIQQCASFPKGRNDDLVDAMSQGMRHLRDLGLLVRSPEREAEIEEAMRYTKPLQPLYPV